MPDIPDHLQRRRMVKCHQNPLNHMDRTENVPVEQVERVKRLYPVPADLKMTWPTQNLRGRLAMLASQLLHMLCYSVVLIEGLPQGAALCPSDSVMYFLVFHTEVHYHNRCLLAASQLRPTNFSPVCVAGVHQPGQQILAGDRDFEEGLNEEGSRDVVALVDLEEAFWPMPMTRRSSLSYRRKLC
jgi:hypothetical protein